MEPAPRKCNRTLPDGAKCEEDVRVINIRYHYTTRPGLHNLGHSEHVLTETHYHVDCPKCGERTDVVTAETE